MTRIFPIKNPEDMRRAAQIRHSVFIHEQQVPAEEEYEFDEESFHYLAVNEKGEAIGTARWRYMPTGVKLERFAVLFDYRCQGVGMALLQYMLQDLKNQEHIYLHAQLQVIPFYEKVGFMAIGDEFKEANIRHRKMILVNH